jgi:anionic cell wall polymer biosynthesis LytR-Cps2A-Psr (LCP) family protein
MGKRNGRDKQRLMNVLMAVAVVVILLSIGVLIWTNVEKSRRLSRQSAAFEAVNERNASGMTNESMADSSGVYGGPSDYVKKQVSYKGQKYELNEDLDNYLFLGIDSVTNTDKDKNTPQKGGQMDAIYLLCYNRREETLKLIAIPRDTVSPVEAFNRAGESLGISEDNICLQYAYGDGKHKSCDLARTAVSTLLYGIPIRGYTSLNLNSLPLLADLVGGVPLTIPDNSLEEVDPSFKEGAVITLDSKNSEKYLRYRNTEISQSAMTRFQRQLVFLKAFAARLQEKQGKDASTVTKVYEGLKPYMVSNMGNDLYVKLATAKIEGDTITIPGDGITNEKTTFDEYHVRETELYELVLETFFSKISE